MSAPHRFSAALCLVVAAFGWALTPVFIRFLSSTFDVFTMPFLRYGSAAVVLAVISALAFRTELIDVLRNHKGLIGLAAVNVTMMCFWTAGCSMATATKAQLISKLSIVFIIIFSFFLFREERAVITNPAYLFGTLLSFVGVAALTSDDPASLAPSLDTGTLVLLATAVLWAVYTVWSRHVVIHCHPIAMFTAVALYTSLGCGLVCLMLGRPSSVLTASPGMLVIAVISGLVPIALGHPCFLFAQKHLGAALCSSFTLLNPLITYGIALLIWTDERLTPVQWVGAGVLLAGTLLVTYVGHGVTVRSAA